jgi:hypothetical protein
MRYSFTYYIIKADKLLFMIFHFWMEYEVDGSSHAETRTIGQWFEPLANGPWENDVGWQGERFFRPMQEQLPRRHGFSIFSSKVQGRPLVTLALCNWCGNISRDQR